MQGGWNPFIRNGWGKYPWVRDGVGKDSISKVQTHYGMMPLLQKSGVKLQHDQS